MKTYCNPLDLPYRYQHMHEKNRRYAFREGADPTLVLFKGTYYLFVSMSAGFFYSQDLLRWNFHPDPDLEIYDYAPDVREIDGWLYFCASSRSKTARFCAVTIRCIGSLNRWGHRSLFGTPIFSWMMTGVCISTGDARTSIPSGEWNLIAIPWNLWARKQR